MRDFSGATMEELAIFAVENVEYVDEASGKKIHLQCLVGGKFVVAWLHSLRHEYPSRPLNSRFKIYDKSPLQLLIFFAPKYIIDCRKNGGKKILLGIFSPDDVFWRRRERWWCDHFIYVLFC